MKKVSVGSWESGNMRRDKRLVKALDNALQCEGKFFRRHEYDCGYYIN